MGNIDFDWVKSQLTEAKVRRGAGDAALVLLQAWDNLGLANEELAKEAVAIFSRLAQGHALVSEDGSEVWIPVIPGQLKVTDVVRIKYNAFDGDLGKIHNGRVGVITAIRYGDIIVKSTDSKKPVIDGSHYSPYHLEKLAKK